MAAAFRRRHIDISAHLTPDELALLAEGKAGEAADKFRSHLAHCKSCFQAYKEAVEFHARALAGKEPHAPPELVKNGRKVPLRRGKKRGVTRTPRGRMILATAGGLVALAAAWIFLGPGGFGGPHLSFMEKGKVEELIAALPDQGPVFPEFSGSKKGQLLRGDGSSLEVEGILKKLQTRVKEGRVNSEDFFWLVSAELAMGKTDMARLHLKEWHAETDTRFMNLKGILAYQESDLTAAETEFREILQEHANEADAEFNLSLVLIAKGDITGARDGLERVLNGKDSQLSERARTVIVSLPH